MTVLVLAAALILSPAPQNQKKPSKKAQPSCLIFGTVFDDRGFLVRGAKVDVKVKAGKGHWEAASDGQGEFAVHLPLPKNVYIVEAAAPGLETDRKETECEGDSRVDVAMHLKRK